ncbi:unnamed protein product [Calypogeia fissa]
MSWECGQAIGSRFSHYAEPVFVRCINLIRTQELAKADPGRAGVAYDKEFIVSRLGCLALLRVSVLALKVWCQEVI